MSHTPTPAFNATGSSGGVDLTDGQLNFTLETAGGLGITNVLLNEGGTYSLSGVGGAATQAVAGANLQVSIIAINGVAVAPIALPSSAASVQLNLAANPGALQPWAVGVSVNVAAALALNQRATRVNVVIDNALAAISEAGSSASIAKTFFDIDINTDIPEPASGVMALVAMCGAGALRSRRR